MARKKYKSSKKKTFKKKSVKKSNKKTPPRRAVNNYGVRPDPFPRVLLTQATYGTSFTLTASPGGVDNLSVGRVFRLNSIYDPDVTGLGRTVVGWNVLSDIYNRYTVSGAKVEIKFTDPSADGIRVGYRIRIGNQGTAIGETLDDLVAQPCTYLSALNNTGSQKKTFKCYVKPWTQLGMSKLEYKANSTNYSAVMNTTPPYNGLLDVIAVNNDTTERTVSFEIKIIYYVKCYERKTLQATS